LELPKLLELSVNYLNIVQVDAVANSREKAECPHFFPFFPHFSIFPLRWVGRVGMPRISCTPYGSRWRFEFEKNANSHRSRKLSEGSMRAERSPASPAEIMAAPQVSANAIS
jgi:hypothetical protein